MWLRRLRRRLLLLQPLLLLQANAAVVGALKTAAELEECNIADTPSSAADAAAMARTPAPQVRELPVSGEDAKQTRGPPEHAATPMNRHGGLNGLASVCLLLHFEVTSGFSPDSIQRSESRAATDTTAQTALALILSESR